MLHGRDRERARLSALVSRAAAGTAESLVIRGEAGIGKTALLDDLARSSPHTRVLRTGGVETETELPYAALHQLLWPVVDQLDGLAAPQRTALSGALGLTAPAVANRQLVGLGLLQLLAEVSEHGPVLCLVDDAHWIDRESADALLFAARRLHAEPVALLFTARPDGGRFIAPGLEELALGGLAPEAAAALVSTADDALALTVRDQVVTEARGNPLALLELPKVLTSEQRAGAFSPLTPAFVEPEALPSRVLRGFRERIATLTPPAQLCLLIAAIDDTGDRDTVLRASVAAGATLEDLAAGERAGLLKVDTDRILPRHPLVRVASQINADIGQLTQAHQALAAVVQDDRRIWHLTAVATGADETLARALDGVAQRAEARGAPSVAASAAQRSARLSAEPGTRFRRLAYAAAAALEAGQLDRAEQLARSAGPGTGEDDPAPIRQLAGVRALLEYERGRPQRAVPLLLDEAAATHNPVILASVLARAMVYTWNCGFGKGQRDLLLRIEELAAHRMGADAAFTRLVAALRTAVDGQPADAVPAARRYLSEVSHDWPFPQRLAATYVSFLTGDHLLAVELASSLVAECRAEGRLALLPQPLGLLATAQLFLGHRLQARESLSEGIQVTEATGQQHRHSHLTALLSWFHALSGDRGQAGSTARHALADPATGHRVAHLAWSVHALTAMDMPNGRFTSVLDRISAEEQGYARHGITLQIYTVPDQVEAATRCGRGELAAKLTDRFTAWAQLTGQAWAQATATRCRALVAPDDQAEDLYKGSLEEGETGSHPLEQARTRLLYGEWLRRRQRRSEANDQLSRARLVFEELGAAGWRDRAIEESRAAGYAAAEPVNRQLTSLTPQELQVVKLAATGATNRDIASRLYLSPRTVAYHLYKAFPKLGISSRSELAARVDIPKQAGEIT